MSSRNCMIGCWLPEGVLLEGTMAADARPAVGVAGAGPDQWRCDGGGRRNPQPRAQRRLRRLRASPDRPIDYTSAASQPTPAVETAVPGNIQLEADGLNLVHFGQPPGDVIAALSERLGVPEEDDSQPCQSDTGARSHWVRWADLSLRFSTTEFVAYIEGVHFPPGSPALDLGTSKSLSPGDSVERLHEIYGDVPVRHETAQRGQIGAELFTIVDDDSGDKVSGVLEQDNDKQIVTSIFGGHLC